MDYNFCMYNLTLRQKYLLLLSLLLFIMCCLFFALCPEYRTLALYFLYTIAACSILPLPVDIGTLGAGMLYSPVLVALVGGIAAAIAGGADYLAISYLLKLGRVSEHLGNNKYYITAQKAFNRAAFVCILVSGFTTILFDAFRLLAFTTHYNRRKYVLAVFLGKTPRFFLDATLGANYLSGLLPWIWVVFLVVMILIIIKMVKTKFWNKKQ